MNGSKVPDIYVGRKSGDETKIELDWLVTGYCVDLDCDRGNTLPWPTSTLTPFENNVCFDNILLRFASRYRFPDDQ